MQQDNMKTQAFDIKNILTPNKFLPVYLERKNLQTEQLPPYSVELHLTSFCNYQCYHCSYGERNKSRQQVEDALIEDLIEDLVDLRPKGVYFSGGGEPTTLAGWDGYANRLLNSGIEVALITNGALISPQHMETISRLNYIAVSIYSTNPTAYRQITGGNRFESGFDLPGMIKAAKGNCLVGARCVINRFNFMDVIDIYYKAMDSGYDYVIFIPEIDYESRGIVLDEAQIKQLMADVQENAGKIEATRTNLLRLWNSRFGYYRKEEEDFSGLCQAVTLRTNLFINYDCGLYLCQPHIGNENFCIGNLKHSRLKTLWNSVRHQEVISSLNKDWASGCCANCRSIAFNKSVEKFEHLGSNYPIEIVKDSFV